MSESLESSMGLRGLTYILLASIAASLVTTTPGGSFEGHFLSGWTVTLVLLAAATLIFHFNYPNSSGRSSKAFLVIGGLVGELFLVRGMLALDPMCNWVLIPVAAVPMIHSVLLGQRVGTFSSIFTAILGALLMPPEEGMPYLAFALVVGFTGVLVTRKVRSRGRLLMAGFYVGLVAVLLGLSLIHI